MKGEFGNVRLSDNEIDHYFAIGVITSEQAQEYRERNERAASEMEPKSWDW